MKFTPSACLVVSSEFIKRTAVKIKAVELNTYEGSLIRHQVDVDGKNECWVRSCFVDFFVDFILNVVGRP